MALFTDISEANRVDEQGGTWDISIRPMGGYVDESGAVAVNCYQWKAEVSFTKSYRYVGLTKDAAIELADAIRTAYTMQRTRQYVRWDAANLRWIYTTVAGDVPGVEADVTPTPMEGTMWQIAVAVSAQREGFYDQRTAPTTETVKGLLSGIDDYPELADDDEEPETL